MLILLLSLNMKNTLTKTSATVATAMILIGSALKANAEQPEQFINPTNGNRYFLTEVLSWDEAKAVAVAAGGNLVTINDANENAWLVDTFINQDVNFLWIGLNDTAVESAFEWVSGQPVTFTNWASGEPNNNPNLGGEDLGALNGPLNPFRRPTGTWTDAPNRARLRGIVEIEAAKNIP